MHFEGLNEGFVLELSLLLGSDRIAYLKMIDRGDSSILLSDAYHTCLQHVYFARDASHRNSLILGSVGVADCTSAVSVNPPPTVVCGESQETEP
jgi:hypothetical protein